jgi:hypothetical protein
MVFLDLLQIRFQQTPKAFEGLPRTSQAVRLGWLGHPSNSHCHPRPHRQTMKTSLWWGPVGFFLTSRLFFFCLARLYFSIKKWSTFELVYSLRGSNRLTLANLMTTNSTLLNTQKTQLVRTLFGMPGVALQLDLHVFPPWNSSLNQHVVQLATLHVE